MYYEEKFVKLDLDLLVKYGDSIEITLAKAYLQIFRDKRLIKISEQKAILKLQISGTLTW